MELLRVENHPELRKDPDSGVVFFFDETANRQHEALKLKNERTISMQNEIDGLKKDMGDIKSMLAMLINK
jgi:hypothetical protein|tara:strand:+ start:13623 stop:13832 length:210 start_codon:yes stop_codon:yes gene_type:complete